MSQQGSSGGARITIACWEATGELARQVGSALLLRPSPQRMTTTRPPSQAELLGELSLDGGCAPSPNESPHSSSTSTAQRQDAEDPLSRARARIAELEAEVAGYRELDSQWSSAISSLVNVLLMSPKQNGNYAAEVSKLLENALGPLSFVERLRYVDCSFPATHANAPKVRLIKWTSLEDSEWHMTFSPAWSCEVCVDGKQLISFSTLLKVAKARIDGRLQLCFSDDLTHVSVSFRDMPQTDVQVECGVVIGHLPLPAIETMGSMVRDAARAWIRDNLVSPRKIKIALSERKSDLTDADVAKAEKAALIAAQRASQGSWSGNRSISR